MKQPTPCSSVHITTLALPSRNQALPRERKRSVDAAHPCLVCFPCDTHQSGFTEGEETRRDAPASPEGRHRHKQASSPGQHPHFPSPRSLRLPRRHPPAARIRDKGSRDSGGASCVNQARGGRASGAEGPASRFPDPCLVCVPGVWEARGTGSKRSSVKWVGFSRWGGDECGC